MARQESTYTPGRLLQRLIVLALLGLGALAATPAHAQERPDEVLQGLLAKASAVAATPENCVDPQADRLVVLMCEHRIRIGVRGSYPGFSELSNGKRFGYEIDIAHAIADKLGVSAILSEVTPANRIALLGEDKIDLVIAEMGHNVQRDAQARFIRPHYYRSQTILVGKTSEPISNWDNLAGRSICVTVGNVSNAAMLDHGVRLMLFNQPAQLPAHLLDNTCTLAAQDDTFFATYFANSAFGAMFSAKFGFAEVPWGMAVPKEHADDLGRAIDLISQIFHRDGIYLNAAKAHHLDTVFLEGQQALWRSAACNTATGAQNPDCVIPPINSDLPATRFASVVAQIETWVKHNTGADFELPMLKTMPAWNLLLDGLSNTLLLISGAVFSTLLFSVLIGWAMRSQLVVLRWPARMITMILQSSPIVLTLVITVAVARAIFPFSTRLALTAAVVALGLANGCNAGQAIAEAFQALRRAGAKASDLSLFGTALRRSAAQITAFLVNAAKGTPMASFIGAPELLSALTDITSFSSGRITTYTILLIFYTLIVCVVIWIMRQIRLRLATESALP